MGNNIYGFKNWRSKIVNSKIWEDKIEFKSKN
jgi:hypothetical protein